KRVVDDGLFRGVTGHKTILVLTDGMDTVSKDPGGIVANALVDQDISLQMVFFQAGNEWATAEAQFNRVRGFNPPGELWQARDQDTLIRHLRGAMQQQIVLQKNGRALRRDIRALPSKSYLEGWPLGGLDPSPNYQIGTAGTRPTNLLLDPGDRVLLDLI